MSDTLIAPSAVRDDASLGGDAAAPTLEFRYVAADDALAKPLLADLEREYDTRYRHVAGHEPAKVEINRYAPAKFAAPHGAFLLVLENGEPVSGGAFYRLNDTTAEIKRVWTRSDRRGRGFARIVLTELEHEARRLGYTQVYLTTGHRQPEAVTLYRAHGYTPLFDVALPAADIGLHAFEKSVEHLDVLPRAVAAVPPVRERKSGAADTALVASAPAAAPTETQPASPRRVVNRGQERPPVASDRGATTGDTESPARRVVPLKHWGRWIFSALALFVVAQLVWTFFSNPQWRWPIVGEYLFNDAVLRGLWLTLWLTAVSAVIGFVLGSVLALARLSGSGLLNSFAWGFIWFFRSVPMIVQLVLWYNLGYLFPQLGFGWPFSYDFWLVEFDTVKLISATMAAIIGLSLHQAAYSAEIIRGGLLSVDQGQLEAAKALGIPRSRRFFRITMPQAARAILPSAFNEIIGLLKGTSVVFIVALPELFYTTQVIYNRNQQVVPLLLVATIWYTVFTSILSVAQYYIERHFARGSARELPPTPIQQVKLRLRQAQQRFVAGRDADGRARGATAATSCAAASLDTDQTPVQTALAETR
ncbi:polar amino acid transport system permease protein [Leucobacter exalbidus]|uniref:Polar amino acid transport system permease protein n=1 Tax=Leucobacter exalbidus TaxID=662960 RepID=A0A940PUH6_9MICO|nr:ABC transporter permease subunit [Leucobacter exalbidus]MBP1327058.1 polar amino acid transport system permease protein [Leucobacter exalbidus]